MNKLLTGRKILVFYDRSLSIRCPFLQQKRTVALFRRRQRRSPRVRGPSALAAPPSPVVWLYRFLH
jgi:hypothetical protein